MAASQHHSDLPNMAVIVMGVSGCGKTSVGEKLAEALQCRFIEGDSLHPPANIAKMSAGTPLDDGDRWPWLDVIGRHLAESRLRGETIVISCSALKKIYRERLRLAAGGQLAFVFLEGSRAVFEARMKNRPGHFMPASLIDSQFAALEPPNAEPSVVTVDVTLSIDAIARQALDGLRTLVAAT
ncbi:gluconokinase [Pararhizobium antarcticum]|uniref:Gluconokinase n=1 Tax=Pararhizobium antarcticum TaxID=1798805 RepID=A0A657LLL4_9HYPH|nr:gluconokinase [Pararhizobium antarcticum]OJF91360.1 gluconokinase [Pararhizobium antarcticum]OJG01338.1 gluconokinase [Rhizobium sp. 58]